MFNLKVKRNEKIIICYPRYGIYFAEDGYGAVW